MAFLKAKTMLGEMRGELGEADVRRIAVRLDVDPDRFVALVAEESVATRVREAADLGHLLGVTGTPTVFLNGRRLDPRTNANIGFWKLVAKQYVPE